MRNNNKPIQLRNDLRQKIVDLQNQSFDELTLDVFRYQALYNPTYSQYLKHLKIDIQAVQKLTEIPFLPIQFFKYHSIQTAEPGKPVTYFESSGTQNTAIRSRHLLFDAEFYNSVSERIFQQQYGSLQNFHILALLPSYLERNNSSLIYMMDHFIKASKSSFSGFYLHDVSEMIKTLKNLILKNDGKKILLLGVTFALLDLAEGEEDLSFLANSDKVIIMDTGGMKGRRQELLREEVHDILKSAFGAPSIHSEYGMTELLSQGYSTGEGLFTPGYTMKILLRDVNDPFAIYDHNMNHAKTGGINVVDLANLDTCAFIETQDLGRYGAEPGTFYVMGRFDNSDIRGCNLMVI